MKKPEVKNLVALSLEVNLSTRKEHLENYRNKISSIVAKNFLSSLSRKVPFPSLINLPKVGLSVMGL
jgi:hypothetical protein